MTVKSIFYVVGNLVQVKKKTANISRKNVIPVQNWSQFTDCNIGMFVVGMRNEK